MFKAIKDFLVAIINWFRKPKLKTQFELEHDASVTHRLAVFDDEIYNKHIKDKSEKRETYKRNICAGGMYFGEAVGHKERYKKPDLKYVKAAFKSARTCYFFAKKSAQTELEKEKAQRLIDTMDYLSERPDIELKLK